MAFIGIENDELGSGADNHSPFFDIDESALTVGAALYAQYAFDFLKYNGKIDFKEYESTPDELYKEVNYV